MAKVTGLGGVFYVVEDPAATRAWYRDVLGIDGEYGPQLDWSEETGDKPYSLISHFPDDQYVKPGRGGFMINLRVDDCDGMVARLEAKGVERACLVRPMVDQLQEAGHIVCEHVNELLWDLHLLDLAARNRGPTDLRDVLQPLVAAVFADGLASTGPLIER